MKLLRSWPSEIPTDRAYVHDQIQRVTISNCDYGSQLADFDDDVILLEWDIATSREDLLHFAEHARQEPERVLAAPYRLYRDSAKYRDLLGEDSVLMLTHWRGPGESPGPNPGDPMMPGTLALPALEGVSACNGFGFGMVYLPRDLIARHMSASEKFTDVTFSAWHYRNERRDVPICWHVKPVHLHYDPLVLPARAT